MSIDLKIMSLNQLFFKIQLRILKPSLVKFCHQINLKNLIFSFKCSHYWNGSGDRNAFRKICQQAKFVTVFQITPHFILPHSQIGIHRLITHPLIAKTGGYLTIVLKAS